MSLRGFSIVIVCRARNIKTAAAFANCFAPKKGALCFSLIYFFGSLAEFILETSNPSRRIIRQTVNSSKYKSEEEFCSMICPDITTAGNRKHCEKIETSPSYVETSSKYCLCSV